MCNFFLSFLFIYRVLKFNLWSQFFIIVLFLIIRSKHQLVFGVGRLLNFNNSWISQGMIQVYLNYQIQYNCVLIFFLSFLFIYRVLKFNLWSQFFIIVLFLIIRPRHQLVFGVGKDWIQISYSTNENFTS